MVIWPQVGGLLVIGYLCMTRSFAYVGVPPLFIGELVLAVFLFLKPHVVVGTWADSLFRPSPLNALALSLLVFMAYGVWETGRGVLDGSPILETFKYFIFNYYALYVFLGLWIGIRAPYFLPKLVRVIGWAHGIYGLVWLVVLRPLPIYLPGSETKLFGWPGGGPVAILGLLCFERSPRVLWPALLLNITVTLAMQHRSEWLGLALGALVWGVLTNRFGRVVAMGMAGLAVLGMIELAGIQLPGRNRDSALSLAEVLGRAIAPIDEKLAKQFSPNAKSAESTVEWREAWWEQIWLSVHATPMRAAFGHGYGFDLFGLAPDDVRAGQAEDIRTPHSVFYFALGYTGWVGVVLFCMVQLAILRLLWRAYRVGGQPVGVVWWFTLMAMALVEQSFDTPYRAIPFYVLVGMAMAPGVLWRGELHAHPARPQLLSVAGR
jgi:O-Antigen ligase